MSKSSLKKISSLLLIFMSYLCVPYFVFAMSNEQAAKKLEAITWYSEEYPPFNYMSVDGTPVGISIDILNLAFEKLGVNLSSKDYIIEPWDETYAKTQKDRDTALFFMTYTEKRSKLFKFAKPGVNSRVAVIATNEHRFEDMDVESLRNLTIGTVASDVAESALINLGFKKSDLIRETQVEALIGMLIIGEIDAVAYNWDVFKYKCQTIGEDLRQFGMIYNLGGGEFGYAFHNDTDPEIIQNLQNVFNKLKKDGQIKAILDK